LAIQQYLSRTEKFKSIPFARSKLLVSTGQTTNKQTNKQTPTTNRQHSIVEDIKYSNKNKKI